MTTPTPITINYIKEENTIAVLNIQGRIDAYLSEIIEEKISGLIENDNHYLILDFMGVKYFSSSGIRVLVNTERRLNDLGGAFVIINMKENVKSVLKIVGLLEKFPVKKSEKEAIAFIKKSIS